MKAQERFFVDERSGCIAVRDREQTDPEYQGLHSDTEGVVWFSMFPMVEVKCECCGHVRQEWNAPQSLLDDAAQRCREFNNSVPPQD